MKIDWKHVATTPGYVSLKAAYTHDVREAARKKHQMRKKAEFLKLFNWVINRAKHYAYHVGVPIDSILNDWEENRSYWWLNYYQEGKQPKFHSKAKKPIGIKGIRNSYKSCSFYGPVQVKHRVNDFIKNEHKNSSTKKKKRWSTERKKRGY